MTTRPNSRMTQGADLPRERRAAAACGAPAFEPDIETSGEIPERPKGSDCKSDGTAFDGSNPSLPTSSRAPCPLHPARPRFALARFLRPLLNRPTPRRVPIVAAPSPRNATSVGLVDHRAKLREPSTRARDDRAVRSRPRFDRTPPRLHRGLCSMPSTLGGRSSMPSTLGGRSSMVERQPSKLHTRVRFPSPAPCAPDRARRRTSHSPWRRSASGAARVARAAVAQW